MVTLKAVWSQLRPGFHTVNVTLTVLRLLLFCSSREDKASLLNCISRVVYWLYDWYGKCPMYSCDLSAHGSGDHFVTTNHAGNLYCKFDFINTEQYAKVNHSQVSQGASNSNYSPSTWYLFCNHDKLANQIDHKVSKINTDSPVNKMMAACGQEEVWLARLQIHLVLEE